MEYRCRHDINWQILDFCEEKPRSLAEIYRSLHLKYPLIYEHVKGLTTIEALDPVETSGIPAFEGSHAFEFLNKNEQELKELRSVFHRFNIKDFNYLTTELGRILLDHQRFFLNGIMDEPVRVIAKTILAPNTLPRHRWRRAKGSPTNVSQNVLIRRLVS